MFTLFSSSCRVSVTRTKMKLFLLMSASLICTIDRCKGDDDQPISYRIIEHQQPEKYTLHLEFKKEVFEGTNTEFKGSLTINFKVKRSIQSIQFHAPVKKIVSKEFIDNQTYPIAIESESFDPVTHIYTITATEKLNYTHNYTLNMEYVAEVNMTDMQGVYRSSYLDEDENMQYFIATQFQPTYARFAFPCFDEPKMKASFSISITYPRGLTVLSNAVEDGNAVAIDDEYEKVTFKETPVMSTYLVGFVLSKLTCEQGKNLANDIPYKICSRNQLKAERSVALQVGQPFIERMENITALNYSDHLLGKLDQVAIPGFTQPYVENWGLVTYRESSLMWNSKESSIAYRNTVMNIFLELAHFWFGDLETSEWWTYLYLNHGFAKFYTYYAASQMDTYKNWDLEKQFVIDQLHPSLVLDALSTTSALSYAVDSPSEILTKFSPFSYSKGSSIIRMAQYVIGTENFQKGVGYFLPIYNGSVVLPIYIWNKLEVFTPRELLPTKENLNGAMDSWTEKAGYPLVTVEAKGNNILLTQQRFLYSGEEDYTEWCIPITYTLSTDFDKFHNTTTKVWLTPGSSQTLYDLLVGNDWIVINNQQVGYYRVNYDDTLWEKIKGILLTNRDLIHVLNRAQIVDDSLNLARASILLYSYAFDIVKYLEEETEYYPWHSAIKNFDYLLTQLGEDSQLGVVVSTMVLELMQKVYKTLSFKDVDPDDQVYILKLLLIANAACRFSEKSCISKAKELYEQYKAGTSVDKNLRPFVYCNALRFSDDLETDWNFLWKVLQSETLSSERETIIAALGCTRDETLLNFYLGQSVNSSSVLTLDDLPKVWSAVYSSSPEGIDASFDYLYENYGKLSSYYSSASSILISITERFTKEDQFDKLEAFIVSGNMGSSDRAIAVSALKASTERMEWVESIKDDLSSYFDIPEDTTEITSTTTGASSSLGISLTNLIILILLRKSYIVYF